MLMDTRPQRAMKGIDECLDRLGELRAMAKNLTETLKLMDIKLHGQVDLQLSAAPVMTAKASSNTEEMSQKTGDIQQHLIEARDYILRINNFINAEID